MNKKPIPPNPQGSLKARPAAAPASRSSSYNLILIILGGAFVLLACLTLLIGGYALGGTRIAALFHTPTPTLPCMQPTLLVGGLASRIETIHPNSDGTLPEVSNKAGVAYWVTGTQPDYVLLLPQSRENLDTIPNLKIGDAVTVTWADCGREAFVVKSVEPRKPFLFDQVDQSVSGVTLVLPVDPTGTVMVVTSGWPAPPPLTETETPNPNLVQAEINFISTSVSSDGATLTQVIEIKNAGSTSIPLTANDISLTYEGSSPQSPLSVEPALPVEITPGQSSPLTINFAKPPVGTAVFRVLDFSADIYY